MNPIPTGNVQQKMGRSQLFIQKLLTGQAFHCLLSTEVFFFNLSLLSVFLLSGRVGKENGIIAEKQKAHIFTLCYLEAGPLYVRFSFLGADCRLRSNFMNTGHISCVLLHGFL